MPRRDRQAHAAAADRPQRLRDQLVDGDGHARAAFGAGVDAVSDVAAGLDGERVGAVLVRLAVLHGAVAPRAEPLGLEVHGLWRGRRHDAIDGPGDRDRLPVGDLIRTRVDRDRRISRSRRRKDHQQRHHQTPPRHSPVPFLSLAAGLPSRARIYRLCVIGRMTTKRGEAVESIAATRQAGRSFPWSRPAAASRVQR